MGDGVQGLETPKLFLHVHEYQGAHNLRSRKTTYSSTNVVKVPHLLKHSAIVPTTKVGNAASLSFEHILDVFESVGSRVGRHYTGANGQAACSPL